MENNHIIPNNIFPTPMNNTREVISAPTYMDTIKAMIQTTHDHSDDAYGVAQYLSGETLEETCRNIWLFAHENFKIGHEPVKYIDVIRTPSRAWHDRATQMGAPSIAVMIGSILLNLSIPFQFRMAAYPSSGNQFSHVYVVVPNKGNPEQFEYVLDATMQFNEEHPCTQFINVTVKS